MGNGFSLASAHLIQMSKQRKKMANQSTKHAYSGVSQLSEEPVATGEITPPTPLAIRNNVQCKV